MPLTLITANRNYSSWSLRPWLLMKALGIAFEDRIELFAADDNHDAFRAFSPSGQVPALIDGERTIWDSLAIAMYLAERFDGVWPADDAARAWAMCAAAEMHGGFGALRNDCTMNVGVRVTPRPASPALARQIARLAELWAEGVGRFGGPWLAGPAFTAVDAFYAPVAFRVRTYGLDVGAAGHAWVEHLLAHPAMRQWKPKHWPNHGARRTMKPSSPPRVSSLRTTGSSDARSTHRIERLARTLSRSPVARGGA